MWHFEPAHSTVEFAVRNLFFFTVRGQLKVRVGAILLDETDIAGSGVKVTLDGATIDTGNRRRDDHLRAKPFLHAAEYPDIEFQSSSVGPGKDRDMLAIKGTLTIKGKSKEILLEASEVDRSRSPQGEEVIYYCATAELDRHAFGINYGRGIIGRVLKVTINVQAIRQE
jgi:polyisoprenoid-binding protein YceI